MFKHFSWVKLTLFLLTIIIIALLCWLGFWQLDRADEKKAMLAHHEAMQKSVPLLLEPKKKQAIENYQPIMVKGIYDNDPIFYLDNQFNQHQLGYEVIEPVLLGHDQVILVSRGWIKAPQSRQELPKISYPEEKMQIIQGTAYFPSESLMVLNDDDVDDFNEDQDWPKRIEKIDIPEIQQWLRSFCGEGFSKRIQVYPFLLRLNASEPDGFVRNWSIVSMPPERHVGYAVQWFGLAFTVFIIYIVLTFRKKFKKQEKKKNDKK